MIPLTYTVTPLLKDTLTKIDSLRRAILLTPLSPTTLLGLRWDANIRSVAASCTLSGTPVTYKSLEEVLASYRTHLPAAYKHATCYYESLQYITYEWIASHHPVTVKSMKTLLELASANDQQAMKRYDDLERDIRAVMAYIQDEREHPVIQSAILHAALLSQDPFLRYPGALGRLAAILVLAKYGYTIWGTIPYVDAWADKPGAYHQSLATAIKHNNITSWLEYMATLAVASLEGVYETVSSVARKLTLPDPVYRISQRQTAILRLLDNPKMSLTNAIVQKRFRISQITASRDLSKLTAFGYLYSHGKGRSIYYTKI